MEKLFKKVESLESKEDFVEFIRFLVLDYQRDNSKWENKDIDSYLSALADWTEEMDGYFAYRKIQLPDPITWKVFAHCLVGASMYE